MFDSKQEAQKAAEMAIGRIARLSVRASQPGDVALYEAARTVFLEAVEFLKYPTTTSYACPAVELQRNRIRFGET